MVEYGDTRTLDPATWTAEERHRLLEFFRILLEWEAARPHTDGDTDDPTHDDRAGDGGTTTAVLYARVSSKDQEREGFSIPAQQKLLRQYAARARASTIVQEFVDVETAKQAGRGGFGEMLRVPEG